MKNAVFKRKAGLFLSVAFIISMTFTMLMPVTAFSKEDVNLNLEVKSAILVDADSGLVLYGKNEDQPLPPASMTKMMTAYLVLEAIKDGRLSWDDEVIASEYANFLGRMPGASVVFLAQGEKRTVRQMFEAMEIASANDATVALAEKVGTTEPMFVDMMNKKAKELGMKDTLFVNSTGLATEDLGSYGENAAAEDNLLSARDLSILARALIKDFPEVLEFSSVPEKEFPNGVLMRNYNLMIPGRDSRYTYEGLDGLKTGHTTTAGWSLTATAKRGDMRLITVVMGGEKQSTRFTETRKLLDYGFNTFEPATLLKGKETIAGSEVAQVQRGIELTVPVVAQHSVSIPIRKGEQDQYSFETVWDEKALVAPIKAGSQVGEAKLLYKGKPVASVVVPLVAQEDVEEAGWLRLLWRAIMDWMGSIFSGFKDLF